MVSIINRAVKKANVIINNNMEHLKVIMGNSSKTQNEKITVSYVDVNSLNLDKLKDKEVNILFNNYIDHKYDILGSGWINVNHDEQIKKKASGTYSDAYKLINWHKDFKSGYEWSSKLFCKKIKIGKQKGVDIKIPWELARLHHLVQLAVFSIKNETKRSEAIMEFQNQVTDFYLNNPVYYGVNWACTMDVGIRAANMVIAYDIFSQSSNDSKLSDSFKNIFYDCLYEHCNFIHNNLEYSEKLTSNHYLANITGLLIASLYLKETPESDKWILFSVNEIINEFKKQFYCDGGNFESSSCYHRLSLEMIIYSISYIISFYNKDKNRFKKIFKDKNANSIEDFFGNDFMQRFNNAVLFLNDLVKPNGNIAQIGDNDSGRFVKLVPSGIILNKDELKEYLNLKDKEFDTENYFDENNLDGRNTLSSASALIDNEFGEYQNLYPLEYSFIRSLCEDKSPLKIKSIDSNERPIEFSHIVNIDYPFSKETKIKSETGISLKEGLEFKYYSDSGIVIYKSDIMHMIVYAVPLGQNGIGGHTHLDKGCIELFLNGKEIYSDPGSYLYTSDLEMRNKFRSYKAHNGIIVKNENIRIKMQNSLKINPFMVNLNYTVKFMEVNNFYLALMVKYEYFEHIREVAINDDSIIIKDFCSVDFEQNFSKFEYFSNGYGKIKKYKS